MQRSLLSMLVVALALLSLTCLTGCKAPAAAPASSIPSSVSVSSPDGTIQVEIYCHGPLRYSLRVDGQTVIQEATLGLEFRGGAILGANVEYVCADRTEVDEEWHAIPGGKRSQVRDRHHEIVLRLREKGTPNRRFEVAFRVFNDGVGFRYILPAESGLDGFILERELSQFAFTANHDAYFGSQEGGFRGPQEWEFNPGKLADIQAGSIIGCPVLIQTEPAWIALTESDLRDWAGIWFCAASDSRPSEPVLCARLAPRLDGDGLVKAQVPHASPWRVILIGRQPGDLIESDLVLNLASPPDSPRRRPLPGGAWTAVSWNWVRPGMMAWDHWWSGETQVDTATIKQYIQLASDMRWPYMLVDWFWYGEPGKSDSDLRTVNPDVDMEAVRQFAHEKNVRLWLWVRFNDLERFETVEEVFDRFQRWGIAGVKLDFMDRDDQDMVNWYERVTAAAAEHELMINFHGAYKPTGMNRTYPNQVTREGLLGNEYNKWSTRVTPEHKVTLPFTRFLCGPADYTPGGFLNRQPDQFRTGRPAQVQGTRAAELALFVIYDSPVCCVCDHPDHYANQTGADFLRSVPTTWEDTRVLEAEVADYLVILRTSPESLRKATVGPAARSVSDFWIAGLTDASSREVHVKLGFLPKGKWRMILWRDGPLSDTNAEVVEKETRFVTAADTLSIRMAPGGGFAGLLVWAGPQPAERSAN